MPDIPSKAVEPCFYCNGTTEDPEHHLSVDGRRALDAQQVGPGGCPACRPQLASIGALRHYVAALPHLQDLRPGNGIEDPGLLEAEREKLRQERANHGATGDCWQRETERAERAEATMREVAEELRGGPGHRTYEQLVERDLALVDRLSPEDKA